MDAVQRSSPNTTQHLLDALQPLVDLGVTPNDAIAQGFGRFPVAGLATFIDDWWFPRITGQFHLHQGTDIFAPIGTPVRAPADGVLRHSDGGLGGLSAYVTQADGTYYYMAHLSAFVPGQADGLAVKVGDVIGYVGNTGDAVGGPAHVHFEIHMDPNKNPYLLPPPPPPPPAPPPAAKGRKAQPPPPPPPPAGPVILGNLNDPALYGRGALPAFDPKPFLDQWLNEAIATVPALIAKLQAGRPQVLLTTAMLRHFDDGRGLFSAPTSPPKAQLLWASSANPSGGPLQLAEAEVSAAVGQLDWATLARRQAARQQEQADRARRQNAYLAPLTPAPLRAVLGL
jgi:murein DD-endopeptidase MepM/ murein hydrolase activator NlpD